MEAYKDRDAMGRERIVYHSEEAAQVLYGRKCFICGGRGGRLYDDMTECQGVDGCAKKKLQQEGKEWQSIEGQIEDEMERGRR